jgi:multiple sugar transport system permease protein
MLADPNFDYRAGLRAAEEQANTKVMRGRDEAQMRRLRPRAWAVFAVAMAGVVWLARQVWRGMRAAYLKPGGGPADRVSTATWLVRALPWLFIGPALALLLMWTYYPLAQGATMAFQDYKILAAKSFVGLDNFITVLLDPKFYKFLWITMKFVVINLLMGFVAPIALAIMLNEIPRGKLLFRMLFLLPQVSSGLVIAFIWRMMYYPSEAGFFNALLLKLAVITKPLQFLNDPSWALLWVTLPAVWAGLGGGSLIYLAALKSVSDDLYEAADVDGAGAWRKLIRITLPSLMPIILINFVGTFIGLFKSMGNIFLMTGGGPGDETTVISLSIWRDSFLYLQFGTATATAWVLAALLASFTVVQLRILSRVEFRKAEE